MDFSTAYLKGALLVLLATHLAQSTTTFEKSQNAASVRVINGPRAQKASPNLKLPTAPNPPRKNLRCGEWQNTATGGIFYKAFEPLLEHERCVWIIGTPGAVGYTVDIQYLDESTNLPESGQELSLLGVGYDSSEGANLSTYLPTSTGLFTVSDANLIVVTFHSSDVVASRTGFALQYEAIEDGNITKTSLKSFHTIFQSPKFDFDYPSSVSDIDRLELAAFVFPPTSNIYTGNPINVYYKYRGTTSLFCTDFLLLVYKYNVNADPEISKWEFVEKMCNDVQTKDIISDDMILVLFHTGVVHNNAGFTFSFQSC